MVAEGNSKGISAVEEMNKTDLIVSFNFIAICFVNSPARTLVSAETFGRG